jgi:hypothetical protein
MGRLLRFREWTNESLLELPRQEFKREISARTGVQKFSPPVRTASKPSPLSQQKTRPPYPVCLVLQVKM